jgi:NAD(P)H-dependent FMN reductase
LTPKIIAFAGSARRGSFNQRLVRVAAGGAETAGVPCTLIDLADFRLPIYDQDLEAAEGLPDAAVRLRELFLEHQGLLISTAEYNGSITPLLKNTIDWITRSPEASPDLSAFQGKLAALMSASPGPLGGLRAFSVVRPLLANVGVTVLSDQVTLRAAHEAFDAEGKLLETRQAQRVEALGRKLADWLLRQHAG